MAYDISNLLAAKAYKVQSVYIERRESFKNLFNESLHNTIKEKLNHAIFTTDLCMETLKDVFNDISHFPHVLLDRHSKIIVEAKKDVDRLWKKVGLDKEDEDMRKILRMDSKRIKSMLSISVPEFLKDHDIFLLTLYQLVCIRCMNGLIDLLKQSDTAKLKDILLVLVEFIFSITPIGPMLSVVNGVNKIKERIQNQQLKIKESSDTLDYMDEYILLAHQWCLVFQILGNSVTFWNDPPEDIIDAAEEKLILRAENLRKALQEKLNRNAGAKNSKN